MTAYSGVWKLWCKKERKSEGEAKTLSIFLWWRGSCVWGDSIIRRPNYSIVTLLCKKLGSLLQNVSGCVQMPESQTSIAHQVLLHLRTNKSEIDGNRIQLFCHLLDSKQASEMGCIVFGCIDDKWFTKCLSLCTELVDNTTKQLEWSQDFNFACENSGKNHFLSFGGRGR